MTAARFRKSEVTRLALAMKEAGVDNYQVTFDGDGKPVLKVRPAAANGDDPDVLNEIEQWAREEQNRAA